jgi:hypothetical protein
MRVKDSIPGEFSISKLNEILKSCIAELSSDAKMFESYQSEEDGSFTGDEYFKNIAKVFWFGGVEVASIDYDGNIVTAEPHCCNSRDAIVLTGCLPDWIVPNEVLYADPKTPCSMTLFKAKSVPGKQILTFLKPDKSPIIRASKLGANDKSVLKTVDIENVTLSTGVFVATSDHGFSEGDHISLSGYVPSRNPTSDRLCCRWCRSRLLLHPSSTRHI